MADISKTSEKDDCDEFGRLSVAFAASGCILLAELIGAVASRSLALLADAAHMITDVAAIVLELWAARMALRPPDAKRTFG